MLEDALAFGRFQPGRFRLDDVRADNAAKCREIPTRLTTSAYVISA
jgi:hypothetical protein